MPSFAEIQEQEKKRVSNTAPPPPPNPSGAPSSWQNTQPRASLLAERISRDVSKGQEPARKTIVPVKPAAPKLLASKQPVAAKPARTAAKPAEVSIDPPRMRKSL